MDITLENLGSSSAYNTILEIEDVTSSPYIAIINGYQIINELADGGSGNINFEINVSDSAPYGHSFSFEISLISEENTYQSTLELSLEKLKESFESGDFNSMLWQLGGNAPWTIDTNDNYNVTIPPIVQLNTQISLPEKNKHFNKENFKIYRQKEVCKYTSTMIRFLRILIE